MAFGVGGRQRRLADPAQPMQGRDREPALAALQRRVDRFERVVAPEKVARHVDWNVRESKRFAFVRNCLLPRGLRLFGLDFAGETQRRRLCTRKSRRSQWLSNWS